MNGSTQSRDEGYVAYGTVTNLHQPKQTCAYPSSGELGLRVEQTTMALRFDGSSTAVATYSYAGRGYSFNVPLTAC